MFKSGRHPGVAAHGWLRIPLHATSGNMTATTMWVVHFITSTHIGKPKECQAKPGQVGEPFFTCAAMSQHAWEVEIFETINHTNNSRTSTVWRATHKTNNNNKHQQHTTTNNNTTQQTTIATTTTQTKQ